MDDLLLALKSANSSRADKRKEMTKIDYYSRLFGYIESRFADGESYTVKNYFQEYSLITKDLKGNDKTVYGLIAENGKTYLGLNDLAFPKRLYKRTIEKTDGIETTSYEQLEKPVYQGDIAVMFDMFKKAYKDALIAFDLIYLALSKHNNNMFVSESFVYPTETFQRFKGEYSTGNFYLFNLQLGGTDKEKIAKIVADICEIYEQSIAQANADIIADETPAETA
jgi:hypothetical protein